MKKDTYGIHWFRRDLRLAGNENLRFNFKKSNQKVLGFFCFDKNFLRRSDFSHNRFAFFIKTLNELKKEMKMQRGDLLVIDAPPHEAFVRLLEYLKFSQQGLPSLISFGRDYEPYARERDDKIKKIIQGYGVEIHSERDHLLIEPCELLKDDKSFYQVYTPYARKWFDKLASEDVQKRIKSQKNIHKYYEKLKSNSKQEEIFRIKWSDFDKFPFQDELVTFEKENNKKVSISIPEAGFQVAFEKLLQFKSALPEYNLNRDLPFLNGTSQLSIYQKNGSLVSSQIIAMLNLETKNFKSPDHSTQYVKEIAWREFYYSILYHRPEVEKKSFLSQYENLEWSNNKQWFERWCEGCTGFPIVDAGMRQLNQTGWMHNRVRMIVASFLVKDLLIDWRWGENYFMKMLLDGDLAPNNGGWQWAASTGCDPQPYFRIFNPWLQAAKFDPEAQYIKTYIPELKNISAKDIHLPDGQRGTYCKPIVNHSLQKEKAILMFKKAKNKA